MSDKEFKIIVKQVLRELQENTDKPFHEIRKIMQKLKEKFNKERKQKGTKQKYWS